MSVADWSRAEIGYTWQLGLHGPMVKDMYYNRLESLLAYKRELERAINDIDLEIEKEKYGN